MKGGFYSMILTTPAGQLDWNAAYDFVDMFPGLSDFGRLTGVVPADRRILRAADRVNFHLRRYLTAQAYTTLHTTLRETRYFVEVDKNAAYHFITLLLEQCKDEMIANEWYELMGRHKRAVQSIHRIISDQHLPAPTIYGFVQTNQDLLKPIDI